MESINHKRNNTSSGADEDDFERFHTGDTVNVVAYSSMAIGQWSGLNVDNYCIVTPSHCSVGIILNSMVLYTAGRKVIQSRR